MCESRLRSAPVMCSPEIKAKLRWKNRLMRTGQTEKADALANQIGKAIVCRNKLRL